MTHKNGKLGKRRGNHCGTIIPKGSGWMARWTIDDPNEFMKDVNGVPILDKDGLPKHKKAKRALMLKAKTRDDARAELDELTRKYGLDHPKDLPERLHALFADAEIRRKEESDRQARIEDAKPGLLLDDAFKAYTQSSKRPDSGPRTLKDYGSHFSIFRSWLAKHHTDVIEVRHVTTTIAEEYARSLKATLSSESHNKKIKFLKRCWRTLTTVPNNKITENPWDGIRYLVPDAIPRREFSIEELTRIAKVLPTDYKILFAIGIYTGLRLKDCALLDWGEVDLIQGKIQTMPRKTKRQHHRMVLLPIHPVLNKILSAIPQNKRTGYVLPDLAAKYKLSSRGSTISRRFNQYLESVGIKTNIEAEKGVNARPQASFHSLRHTFTTIITSNGGSYQWVQKMLGHKGESMTDHYMHETLPALFETVCRFPTIPTLLSSNANVDDVIDVTDASAAIENSSKQAEIAEKLQGISGKQLDAILKIINANRK